MRKKLFPLIFLFNAFLLVTQAQNNSNGTVFILSNGFNGDFQNKIKRGETQGVNEFYYNFFFNEGNDIKLVFSKYKNFDDQASDNPRPCFRVNKSFIEDNKEIIFTGRELNDLGYSKAFKLLQNAKHIFLIDMSEIINDQIIIKEVTFLYIGEE